MLAIEEHVLKAGPWSISKAGVIEKCSLQFDFKYGPNKVPEVVKSEESRVGVAVHKALELILEGHNPKLAFQIAADENELTHDEIDQLQSFWDQVLRFKKRIDEFKKKYGVKRQYIEQKWGVKTDFSGCEFFAKGVFFRGVVDFALDCAGDHMVIIDHKSGKQKEMEYYDKQFRGYAVMALARNPSLKGVQTAVNFIATDQFLFNPYVKAEQIRDEYQPWLIKYLHEACKGLLLPPAPTKGPLCNWCGYRPICPLFKGLVSAPESSNQ